MEEFLNKKLLTIFWIVLFVHCVFQFFVLPYRAVTKPMLVPILLTYLLLKDENIGKPIGKSIFYIGLFLALFGDVLLIIINDTFFLAGMIAFMLMNIFYSISFACLSKPRLKSILSFCLTILLLTALAIPIFGYLSPKMGDYRMPVMIYQFTLVLMVAFAVNILGSDRYRKVALRYLVPGAVIFLIENILVAYNLFAWDRNKDVYIIIMLTYGTAQYLMVRGILKAYL
ncbi:MAG: lysoplasmalogenase [Sediminibacterium sp.]